MCRVLKYIFCLILPLLCCHALASQNSNRDSSSNEIIDSKEKIVNSSHESTNDTEDTKPISKYSIQTVAENNPKLVNITPLNKPNNIKDNDTTEADIESVEVSPRKNKITVYVKQVDASKHRKNIVTTATPSHDL